MPAAKADVLIRLLGDSAGFTRELTKAQWQAMALSKKMQVIGKSMQSIGRTMTVGVTLPIVAGFTLATKAAVDEEKEMALLSKAIQNNTRDTRAQIAATEDWITAQQNATGIADGELRPALAALVAVTKDTGKAQDLLQVAMDISVAKGLDLTTVSEALAKGYLGNIGLLSRYGIATRNAKGEVMSFDEVMQNAAETFGGSAAKAAETSAGKFAIMVAKLQDLSEEIGSALIPVLTELIGVVTPVIDKFSGLSDGWKKAIVIVGLVVAAIGPLLTVLGTIISIAPAVGAAFTFMTGPVGIVIVAIAALVAILVVLYKKNETFRNVVNAVWGAIKAVVSAVVKAVIAYIKGWIAAFNVVLSVGRSVLGGLKTAFGWVVGAAKSAWDWIKKVAAVLAAGFDWTPLGMVKRAIESLLGPLRTAWDYLSKILGSSGRVQSSGQNYGRAGGRRGFATGGIAVGPDSGYTATLHGTELIVPLNGRAFSPASSGTINVNVVVPGGTTLIGTAREVGDILAPHVARALGRTAARQGRRR